MRFRLALACLTVCFLAGCEKDSPTSPGQSPSPSASSLSGRWNGTLTADGVAEMGGISMTAQFALIINQAGGTITGTWQGATQGATGTHDIVTGTADGDTVVLVLGGDYCSATVTGTRSDRSLNLSGDGFLSVRGNPKELCRTSTMTASLTKQ